MMKTIVPKEGTTQTEIIQHAQVPPTVSNFILI